MENGTPRPFEKFLGMHESNAGEAPEGANDHNANWSFAGKTPQYFDQHVEKSIPFYSEGHDLVAKLSDYFVHGSSICYELGTSTGTLLSLLALRHQHRERVRWVGIDCVEAMVSKAREKLAPELQNVSFIRDDVSTFPYQKSDFIVAYYCVQFIPPRQRQELISRIYQSLNWGGAFVMFEKVRASDARFQDYMTGIYTDYKLDQGHTAEEIVAKSRSLKRVLEPFSTQGNLDLFKRAGFVDVMSVMKYACFEGFLAIK